MKPARWLKRLFSSTVAPSLPAAVQELLQAGAPVQVQKVRLVGLPCLTVPRAHALPHT